MEIKRAQELSKLDFLKKHIHKVKQGPAEQIPNWPS